MSKTAFIYPGQGAQKAGMGADFYERSETARAIFDQAGEKLGLDMKALCFEENEKLDLTEYTQAALVTTCLAMTRVAKERGLKPDITAGLSLGEYSAIAAAGGMDDLDAVRLVRKRGILMQNTVPAGEGGMCAVMGMEASKIEEVLEEMAGEEAGNVTVANYNCPGQIVITGEKAAVDAAGEALKAAGAKRIVPLKVSGPFHSQMLSGAGEKLGEALKDVKIADEFIPYLANVTADYVTKASDVKPLLTKQVASSVRWQQTVERLIADGADEFLEIGPGKTLTGFMRKINRDVKVNNIDKLEDFKNYVGK